MLLNAETAISTSKIVLVPYSTWHVPRYHEWMQDEEIQEATASEPLTLEEEYAMQCSWRQDADKLTFIACRPISRNSEELNGNSHNTNMRLMPDDDSPANMVGDINLFLRVNDGEDGDSPASIIGEIELMIAEKVNQRKGYGRAALVTFLKYIIEKQDLILAEFVSGCGSCEKIRAGSASSSGSLEGLAFECLSVKIGKENGRSLALFDGLGFVKVKEEPSFFGEFELRRRDLRREWIDLELERAGVDGYVEVGYERREKI